MKVIKEEMIVIPAEALMNNMQTEQEMPVGFTGREVSAQNDCVIESATRVMAAYQNANKWLDITKEIVYTNFGCVFFSSYIHELAHTMPGRFDKFGDILHTINMKIPYPATEYIPSEPSNISEVFNTLFMILDDIKNSLNDFIKCTDEQYHGMACAAEELLNDIEGEYPMLFRLQQEWAQCGEDMIKFDKYVNQYVKNKDGLLEGYFMHDTPSRAAEYTFFKGKKPEFKLDAKSTNNADNDYNAAMYLAKLKSKNNNKLPNDISLSIFDPKTGTTSTFNAQELEKVLSRVHESLDESMNNVPEVKETVSVEPVVMGVAKEESERNQEKFEKVVEPIEDFDRKENCVFGANKQPKPEEAEKELDKAIKGIEKDLKVESKIELDESLFEEGVGTIAAAGAAAGAAAKFVAGHWDEILQGLEELGIKANNLDANVVDIIKRHKDLNTVKETLEEPAEIADDDNLTILEYTEKAMQECGLDDEIDTLEEMIQDCDYDTLISICQQYIDKCNDIHNSIDDDFDIDSSNISGVMNLE